MLHRALGQGSSPGTFLPARDSLPARDRSDPYRMFAAVRRWQLAGSVRVSGSGGSALSLWERVRPHRCADCGQLMAGSTSRPAKLYLYCFRSARRTVGRVAAIPGRRLPGHRPGARLLLFGRIRWVAGLGRGGGAAAYVESLGNRLPAAGPGRLNVAIQPAVGGLSALGLSRGGRPSRPAYIKSH